MSFQYLGFTVGERVRITVDFPPCGGNGLRRVVSTFAGTVAMPDRGDPNDTIRLTTGNPQFPERIIPVDKIVGRKKAPKRIALQEKTWEVASSTTKGKFYTVTQKGRFWSCTCPGYGFRHFCQHIKRQQSI